jgi:hypothetical protein
MAGIGAAGGMAFLVLARKFAKRIVPDSNSKQKMKGQGMKKHSSDLFSAKNPIYTLSTYPSASDLHPRVHLDPSTTSSVSSEELGGRNGSIGGRNGSISGNGFSYGKSHHMASTTSSVGPSRSQNMSVYSIQPSAGRSIQPSLQVYMDV